MKNLNKIFVISISLFINYTGYTGCSNKPIVKDQDAIDSCIKNRRSYIAIVWPITLKYKNHKKIDNYLNSLGTILYKKKILLQKKAPKILIDYTYQNENIFGKESKCFPKYSFNKKKAGYLINAYLLDYPSYNRIHKIKHQIRHLFNLGFNSIHITDTHKQAIALAHFLFNQDNLDFINSK